MGESVTGERERRSRKGPRRASWGTERDNIRGQESQRGGKTDRQRDRE